MQKQITTQTTYLVFPSYDLLLEEDSRLSGHLLVVYTRAGKKSTLLESGSTNNNSQERSWDKWRTGE